MKMTSAYSHDFFEGDIILTNAAGISGALFRVTNVEADTFEITKIRWGWFYVILWRVQDEYYNFFQKLAKRIR